ncbi:MAG: 5-(carboxyamino)imidazole ribonucleotide synthase [Rhodobacterales bacterium]|nr:MAG: 5-(carboxyamino)imidazole ribonucleotide synthase [Rhodobacterales bacterium]
MTEPLQTGAVIGILGGGQLGRMLSVAASRLGLATHIFEPGANPPAADVAAAVTTADYSDHAALESFARSVDVITYEFENIPAEALDVLEALRPVRPGREALRISQDRIIEKRFLNDLGLKTAPFAAVNSAEDLTRAAAEIGIPSILKTCRFGYDGKGQARLSAGADLAQIWDAMAGAPSVLEGFIAFEREISVIAARGLDGSFRAFEPGENVHRDGILHRTTLPANIPDALAERAVTAAHKVLDTLDYVGVMGVEFFVSGEELLVNEIAPRVHNSGHWTQNGCAVDQFEQHIRAVAGWPLADPVRHADVVMENLIGDDVLCAPQIAQEPGAALHLYGKAEVKAGRKMGHVNRVTRRS